MHARANLLRSSVRGSDAVIRYGGDEFLVLLADTSFSGAGKVVDRIAAYVRDWNSVGRLDGFKLSLSIGRSEWTEEKTLDQVLDAADREMYARKSSEDRFSNITALHSAETS